MAADSTSTTCLPELWHNVGARSRGNVGLAPDAAMLDDVETMEVPQGRFELARWRSQARSPLRAWDAADEYVLDHHAPSDVADGRWLVVNDAFGALAVALHERSPLSTGDSWTAFAAARRNADHNGLSIDPDHQRPALAVASEPIGVAIIKVPKSSALLEDQLRRLRPHLRPGAVVTGAGMTRHIHRSTLEIFERVIGPTTTSLARKKARLIHARLDPELEPGPLPHPSSFVLPGGDRVINHANVFSRDRLDIGTRLLLDHLPDSTGRVVDLGCGSGILALAMARQEPGVELVLRDDSFHAVASARATLDAADVDGDVRAGDGVADLEDASVDVVISNPPFHDDHAVGDEVAWSFFTGARRVLRPGGELRIVGNRHLGYHAKLKRIFGNVDNVASDPKFVILRSVR